MSQPQPDQAPVPEKWRRADVVTLGSLCIAALSLVLGVRSIHLSSEQTRLSESALEQSRQVEDLRFIGRISIQTDPSASVIRIANKGLLAVAQLGTWSIGETISTSRHSSLDTIKAGLPGLGACTSLELPIVEMKRNADLTTAPHDSAARAEAEAFGPSTAVVVQDVFVTLQAPSGRWYTVSAGGAIDDVTPDANHVSDAAVSGRAALFSAMGNAEVLNAIGDTIAEGVDVERNFSVNVESDTKILKGVPRAIATYSSNSCQ